MIPIGHPNANSKVYILDPSGQPVPIGVSGEIHIGGDGVARVSESTRTHRRTFRTRSIQQTR